MLVAVNYKTKTPKQKYYVVDNKLQVELLMLKLTDKPKSRYEFYAWELE
jgi:hypothetical protein